MIHPEFKLNGKSFNSTKELKEHAQTMSNQPSEEQSHIAEFLLEWLEEKEYINVKTSGSTGSPKNIALKKSHVVNSANATIDYFQLFSGTKALLCLSSKYIAGKMMLVRAMVAGWDLHTVDPVKDPLENIVENFDFTAMVPYQVFYSLKNLGKVKKLIIGGGAISTKLEEQLQKEAVLAFATYGMTETISHIAVRQINGKRRSSYYSAILNVEFSISSTECLQIHAPKISEEIVETNDVVKLLSPTSFSFIGRIDNVINSGGIKIHPEEVERKISFYLKMPFFISSEKDEALGEQIVLLVESEQNLKLYELLFSFKNLSSYERPKKLYVLPQFLYTETEKIRRSATLRLLRTHK